MPYKRYTPYSTTFFVHKRTRRPNVVADQCMCQHFLLGPICPNTILKVSNKYIVILFFIGYCLQNYARHIEAILYDKFCL